jgi:hypothetical protein
VWVCVDNKCCGSCADHADHFKVHSFSLSSFDLNVPVPVHVPVPVPVPVVPNVARCTLHVGGQLGAGDVNYAGCNIRVLEGYRKDGFITSKLQVTKKGGGSRIVFHYWFDSWSVPRPLPCRHGVLPTSLSIKVP